MQITIIIPTYNSERYIKDFISGVMNIVTQLKKYHFQFLFIDDGSSDSTVTILKDVKKEHENISILVLSKNFGQTNAILAGLKNSESDAYIMMSVDMQESPELIYHFIEHWEKGYKLCIAYREYRTDNFLSKLMSKLFYFIIRIDNPAIPKGGFDYGLLDNDVAIALLEKPLNYRFLQGDIIGLGYPIKYIPCTRSRNTSTSKRYRFPIFKFNYFFDGIINVVRIPFKLILLASLLSVILFSFNLIYQGIIEFSNGQLTLEKMSPHLQILLTSFLILLISFLIEFTYRVYDIITQKKEYVVKEFIK